MELEVWSNIIYLACAERHSHYIKITEQDTRMSREDHVYMDTCRSYKPCNATPANELGAHRSTDCADVHLTSSGQVTYLANASILVVNDQVVIGILIIIFCVQNRTSTSVYTRALLCT